jgi:hypothetical protein
MGQDRITLQEVVECHRVTNGFPADGGVNERWVTVRVGPVPFCFPNTNARRRAVPIHDLNHVVSAYSHEDIGEAEIGAFELGGGCKDYWAAWVLNWAALAFGVVRAPRRTLRAFARGRRTGNLYGADLGALRQQPVEDVRKTLGLDKEYQVRTRDFALFVAFASVSPLIGAISACTAIVTSPFWLAAGAHRRRRITA